MTKYLGYFISITSVLTSDSEGGGSFSYLFHVELYDASITDD